MKQSEHDIQRMLFLWAKYTSNRYTGLYLMFAIPNGGARDKVTGAILKAEGVKPGIPDIFLPVPCGPYHGLFIELKSKGGRASDKQKEYMFRLSELGYCVRLCKSFDEAVAAIQSYYLGSS